MEVSIVVLATGKYQSFLPRLIGSAEKYLVDLSTVYVLSDRPLELDSHDNIIWLPWGHLQWPYSTLMRYEAISTYSRILQNSDVLLHIDADMYFNDVCNFSSVRGLIAVEHPGYVGKESSSFPYESNPRSTAYMPASLGKKYFAGGVQGGKSTDYLKAAFEMSEWIQQDLTKSIVPIWHDESIWNRYLADSFPDQIYSSDYCCPDTAISISSKIIAISKDHAYFRDGQQKHLRGISQTYLYRFLAKIYRAVLPKK
jgi:hypothetical protein